MTPFSNHGTIRQQDIQACNIARSAIARFLDIEARYTALLVTQLITKTHPPTLTVATLWTLIQNNVSLRSTVSKTDAYVAAYMQFSGWVTGARLRVAHAQQLRLTTAFGPRLYANRIRNSDRLTRLHLLSHIYT